MIVNYDNEGINKITDSFLAPFMKMENFFKLLATVFFQNTDLMFRLLGARPGSNIIWKGYSLLTQHPSWKAVKSSFPEYAGKHYNPDTWNIRRGTDNSSTRRYAGGDKMLQASSGFRQSFKVQSIDNKHLSFGTIHEKAEKIMSRGREVLILTDDDKQRMKQQFIAFLNQYMNEAQS